MKTKTAIQQLIEKIKENQIDCFNFGKGVEVKTYISCDFLEEMIKLEKQQIIKSFEDGQINMNEREPSFGSFYYKHHFSQE